ncbi:hypothetical protein F4678DRAFT_464865 [Xylaria arbuscula]|nr:hypothetical protein F4678DRAFT_464865 [Xylaria arbuscula]
MSHDIRENDTASARSDGSSTAPHISNFSNEEFKDFRKIYEINVLPAIIQILEREHIGGQVYFLKRKFITVVTREEAPPSLKHQVEHAVATELREDFRAKISIEFKVGEVVRSCR